MRYAVLFLGLLFCFTSCSNQNPKIIFYTEKGEIEVELYTKEAPLTANNFLTYVEENRLVGSTFYRTVRMNNQPDNNIKIEVIQGGLYEDEHPNALAPIDHETTDVTGILHKDGVISMARMGPGTATCEIFICVGDQPSLDYGGGRNNDGQGFAAFGKVVKGMDIVHAIHHSPADGQWLAPRIKIVDVKLVD